MNYKEKSAYFDWKRIRQRIKEMSDDELPLTIDPHTPYMPTGIEWAFAREAQREQARRNIQTTPDGLLQQNEASASARPPINPIRRWMLLLMRAELRRRGLPRLPQLPTSTVSSDDEENDA